MNGRWNKLKVMGVASVLVVSQCCCCVIPLRFQAERALRTSNAAPAERREVTPAQAATFGLPGQELAVQTSAGSGNQR